jgi:hypothetical protein
MERQDGEWQTHQLLEKITSNVDDRLGRFAMMNKRQQIPDLAAK